jgi:tetratricopeptide (TPR) repeat protein
MDDARAALLACTTTVPDAADCLAELNDLDAYNGRCEEAENGSRRLIALEPENPTWYEYLARAVYGRSRDLDAARAAFDVAVEHVPATGRDSAQHKHAFGLAVLLGDFGTAEHELRDWEQAESADPAELSHALRAGTLVDLYVEWGEPSRAAGAARDFLRRRTTWIASRRFNLEIVGWQGLYSANAISRAEFVRHRDQWFAQWPALADRLWEPGYVQAPLKSIADASDVIEHRPAALGFLMTVRTQDGYGEALRMTAHLDEALPELQRAAHNCRAVFFPIEHTRANLHLGLALEAHGDRDAACEAYATIEERWGKISGSETARTALAHAKKLKCPLRGSGP